MKRLTAYLASDGLDELICGDPDDGEVAYYKKADADAEIKRLREALRAIVERDEPEAWEVDSTLYDMRETARDALDQAGGA